MTLLHFIDMVWRMACTEASAKVARVNPEMKPTTSLGDLFSSKSFISAVASKKRYTSFKHDIWNETTNIDCSDMGGVLYFHYQTSYPWSFLGYLKHFTSRFMWLAFCSLSLHKDSTKQWIVLEADLKVISLSSSLLLLLFKWMMHHSWGAYRR